MKKFLPSSFSTIFLILLCSSVQNVMAGPFDELIINGGFESSVAGNNKQIIASADTTRYTQLDSWVTSTDTDKLTFLFAPGAGDTTGSQGRYYDTTPFTLWGSNNGGAGPTALGPSPLGGNYIAMDGDSTHNVSLTQTVSGLIIGQDYNVSFYWAAAQQQSFDGATTEKWQVSLGSQTQSTPVFSLANHGFSGWIQQTMTFTATSTSAALSFLAIGTPDGVPPFALLDGVSMIAVPEPNAFGLIVVALLGFGWLHWKRKKAARS
jgi:hypothetical protein